MPSIAILIFEGVEELDFVGPWEVLAAWGSQHPDDDVQLFTVGWTGTQVRCAKRLQVTADRDRAGLGEPDVLLLPGGRGTRALIGDTALLRTLREAEARGAWLTSVCTGALVFAAAGLLDGKPATTHWSTLDALAKLGKDV